MWIFWVFHKFCYFLFKISGSTVWGYKISWNLLRNFGIKNLILVKFKILYCESNIIECLKNFVPKPFQKIKSPWVSTQIGTFQSTKVPQNPTINGSFVKSLLNWTKTDSAKKELFAWPKPLQISSLWVAGNGNSLPFSPSMRKFGFDLRIFWVRCAYVYFRETYFAIRMHLRNYA